MKHTSPQKFALFLLGAMVLGGGTVTDPVVGPAPPFGIGGPGMVPVSLRGGTAEAAGGANPAKIAL